MSSAADAVRASADHGTLLARGALVNTLTFLASNLRGIFTFLVARLLGSAALGTFGLAWAATDLVSKIATCGFETSAIAIVARREAAGDFAGSRRVMRLTVTVSLTVSAVVAVVGAVSLWTVGPLLGLQAEIAQATAILLLALPGIALYRVSNALSRGKGVMHHDIYSRGFTESFATAAALIVAIAAGTGALAPEIAAIAGTLASGVIAFALAQRLFTRHLRGAAELSVDASRTDPQDTVGSLLWSSAPVALYGLLNIGVMHIDVIMLGLYVGRAPGVTLETLGIYAAACAIAGGLRKVNQAFTPIFTPVVAQQMWLGDRRSAEASYGYLARWMLAILLPAVAVLALSGDAIMAIFGPGFSRGGPWLAIVGAACALNAFVGLGELILMIERPSLNLANSSLALAAVVGMNILLIPVLGPLGAALGMVVPYALQGVLRGTEMSWLLGWRWPWRSLSRPWLAALLAMPPAILVRLSGDGSATHAAAGVLYVATYLAAWRIIGIEPCDRAVLKRLLQREAGEPVAAGGAS